jgi:multicomponent Na+:H+ antiporter subunit E
VRRTAGAGLGLALLAIWLLLWGEVTVANVLSGLVTVAVVLAVVPDVRAGADLAVRPVWALRFLVRVVTGTVRANLVVTREILTRGSGLHTGIVAVPMPGCSDSLLTVMANVLALAPGTMPIEVTRTPPVVYVHVLHLHDVEQARREMGELAALAVRAFGPADAVAALP